LTAQSNFCIVDNDNNNILLLLQDDKRLTSIKYSEPQLIAAFALALYNMKRERDPETQIVRVSKSFWGIEPRHKESVL
jgi:hypothetical protein